MSRPSKAPSERVRVKRLHERGAYDRASIDAILDACPVALGGYIGLVPLAHVRNFRMG